jgi:hypothetical protein
LMDTYIDSTSWLFWTVPQWTCDVDYFTYWFHFFWVDVCMYTSYPIVGLLELEYEKMIKIAKSLIIRKMQLKPQWDTTSYL